MQAQLWVGSEHRGDQTRDRKRDKGQFWKLEWTICFVSKKNEWLQLNWFLVLVQYKVRTFNEGKKKSDLKMSLLKMNVKVLWIKSILLQNKALLVKEKLILPNQAHKNTLLSLKYLMRTLVCRSVCLSVTNEFWTQFY